MPRYFAQIENNIVTQVTVCDSKEWCEQTLGGIWVETFESNYAGIGHTYHSKEDKFSSPRPHDSWALDANKNWQPPKVRIPDTEGKLTTWDEKNLVWKVID